LGTLTALTVDDVAIDGKVVTMTGSSGDTATLTVGTNGTLDITTVDTAAAAANMTLTADGTFEAVGTTITLDSGGAINLEPAAGSAILLDGTISVDAGVVTGATSITSTAFVGALTGNVTGNTSGTAATVTTAAQTNITSLGSLTGLDVNGAVTINDNLSLDGSNKELRFYEGANYVGFEAPALSADQIWVLPTADGSANQTLKTDGSGTLSWATAASAVSNLTDVTITSLANGHWLRYNGSNWVNEATAVYPTLATMTGDASDTTLALGATPLHENATHVYLDGVYQNKDTYSVSGSTLTFSEAPPLNVKVEAMTNVLTNILQGNDVAVDTMTGDNSDTTLTLSVTPSNENHVNVYFNGVYQEKSTWSLSGTTVTFSTAPPTGVTVEAVSNQMLAIGTATGMASSVLTGLAEVTAVDADHVLIYDASGSALKKSLVSDFAKNTSEEIADIVGAMVSSNTESGITVAYEDGDNTLDFTVGTLNQDTTGLAGTATALATARTIAMTGDVVWSSGSFDGSGNVTAAATIQTDAVDIAMLSATGTASSSTFLRGDNAWTAIVSSPITALNNATANEVVTVGSTTTELDAEAKLVFDGEFLGVAVTPEANWASDANGIQFAGLGAVWGKSAQSASSAVNLTYNVYDHSSTGQAYIVTDEASMYQQDDGEHRFYTAASGSADAAISFTNKLKIGNTGHVTVAKSAAITQTAITSSSAAVAWDAHLAANAYHLTTENTTFSAPSNAVEGAIISVEIAQGGTARTIAWNTVFEFAASTAPTITATASKTDILSFRYNGSVWQEIGRVQNMAQT
jgi:hypothetical protein